MIGSFNAGMAVLVDGEWQQANGSSDAVPAWAALLAIIDQGRGLLGEQPLTSDEALTMLYALPSSDFNKISQLDDGTDVPANYNDAAGLGSPVANALAAGMDGGQDTITGTVTSELTGAPLPGWTVYLAANDNPMYQPGIDPVAITTANGTYSFVVAPGDDYKVLVQPPPGTGLVQTSANPGALSFAAGANLTATGNNFLFAQPILTGRLDPTSDSGLSDDDGITNVGQPIFLGTTLPGLTVKLYAQAAGLVGSVLLGTTTANSQGAWSLTSTALADGRYTIAATAIDAANGLTYTVNLLPDATERYLTIDTQAPEVVAFSVTPAQGEIFLTIQDDLSGLAQPSVVDTQNYTVRLGAHGRPLAIRLSTSLPSAPTGPQRVEILVKNGVKLKPGTYFLEVASGGVEDVAGNALAGSFRGVFPTGPGITGKSVGNTFDVRFTVTGRHATKAKPVPSAKTSPKSLRSPTRST